MKKIKFIKVGSYISISRRYTLDTAHHKQRDGAYPYGSVKVPEACRVVIGSIEEVAVGLGQETIS